MVGANLSTDAESYIKALRPASRTIAREWAETDDDEFKARIGVAVDQMSNGRIGWRLRLVTLPPLLAAGAIGGATRDLVVPLMELFGRG